jgi:hypothetical protein
LPITDTVGDASSVAPVSVTRKLPIKALASPVPPPAVLGAPLVPPPFSVPPDVALPPVPEPAPDCDSDEFELQAMDARTKAKRSAWGNLMKVTRLLCNFNGERSITVAQGFLSESGEIRELGLGSQPARTIRSRYRAKNHNHSRFP